MQLIEKEVSKEAVLEWLEHPVTAWFAVTLGERADIAVEGRANTFAPGEPQKTQERISYLNGSVDELNLIHGVLNEEWDEGEICPLNYLTYGDADE